VAWLRQAKGCILILSCSQDGVEQKKFRPLKDILFIASAFHFSCLKGSSLTAQDVPLGIYLENFLQVIAIFYRFEDQRRTECTH